MLDFALSYATIATARNARVIGGPAAAAAAVEKMSDASGQKRDRIFLLIFKRGESVMVFSSASFLIFFLPCLLVLYFLVPRRCRYLRNLVLLAFSLAFYACGGPKFLLLMLLSIAINYAGGLLAGPAHRPRQGNNGRE